MKFYPNCLKCLKTKDITPFWVYTVFVQKTITCKGKWDDARLEDILKSTIIQFIYNEALRSGKPVFCIVDDTISSKTKPSSQVCTRLKMRISTSPISRENRTMDIRP